MEILYVQSLAGSRRRDVPSLTGTILSVLEFGTSVKVEETRIAETYIWRQLVSTTPGMVGWIAQSKADMTEELLKATPGTFMVLKGAPVAGSFLRSSTSLKLRAGPGLLQPIVTILPMNVEVKCLSDAVLVDRYWWCRVSVTSTGAVGWSAIRSIGGAEVYLVPATPIPEPSTKRFKMGYHLVQSQNWGYHRDFLLREHAKGRLAGVTIVNNTELANILVQNGVEYVVHRTVSNGNESVPAFTGNSSDIQIGINAYKNVYGNNQQAALDKRVYIQLYGCNEANRPNDGYFYLGACQAATADGCHLVCFNDPVGNPNMWVRPDGSIDCPTLQHRRSSGCLAYMKANGHLYGNHGYGAGGGSGWTGNEPGSAIYPDGHRDEGQWFWYGGRWIQLYRQLDPSEQPDVMITEAGTFNADFGKAGGTLPLVSDLQGYQTRYGDDIRLKAFSYWTLGEMGGWAHSDLSPAIPTIESHTFTK